MAYFSKERLLLQIQRAAQPLHGSWDDFDSLLANIGDARFVLMGEASHGTHEFYRIRAELTKRLIREKGFNAVAVEADWPDAYRVNRFVQSWNQDQEAIEALEGFKRFPTWMWRNADILDFVGWLRSHNDECPEELAQVGFYGLDIYSLYASIEAVITYLQKINPEAAERARQRYACFENFGEDPQAYAYATQMKWAASCEEEVMEQLQDLTRKTEEIIRRDGLRAQEELFCARQNARLVRNAENYYRNLLGSGASTWNLRDTAMMECLKDLQDHLEQMTGDSKIVVWAHNSHVGDARHTQMGEEGELNLGQLVRERYPSDTFILGFTTHHGTVTAASHWGGEAQRMRVRPGLPGSYEELFHDTGIERFLLNFSDHEELASELSNPWLERAIGVIYLPRSEGQSHYFQASLSRQFDALIHIDETRGVEPLERTAQWKAEEYPETYPTGI